MKKNNRIIKKNNFIMKTRVNPSLWGGVLHHFYSLFSLFSLFLLFLLPLFNQNILAAESDKNKGDKLDELVPHLEDISYKKYEKFRLKFLDAYPGTQLEGDISLCGPMQLEGKQDSVSSISPKDQQEIISNCGMTVASHNITIAREIHLASPDARDILDKFFAMKFIYPNNEVKSYPPTKDKDKVFKPFKKLREVLEKKLGPLGSYFERNIIIGEEVDLVPGDTFANGDANFALILIRKDGKSIGWSINWWYAS